MKTNKIQIDELDTALPQTAFDPWLIRQRDSRYDRRRRFRIISTAPEEQKQVLPSQLFKWLKEIEPSDLVVFDRVSTDGQENNGNLKARKQLIINEFEKLGHNVIAYVAETANGWLPLSQRVQFQRAIRLAKAKNAIVAATSIYRIRRRKDPQHGCQKYNGANVPPPLTEHDLKILNETGVAFATYIHPDASISKIRSYESHLGRTGKKQKGGRPRIKTPKKLQRKENFSKVRWSRLLGLGRGAIEKITGISIGTQRRWELRKCA